MYKKNVVLFGAGEKLKKCIASMDYEYNILWISDNNDKKWGMYEFIIHGDKKIFQVKSPENLRNSDVQVIITVESSDEIKKQLQELSVQNVEGLYDVPWNSDVYNQMQLSSKHEEMLMNYIDTAINNTGYGDWISEDLLLAKKYYVFRLWNNHYEIPYIFQRTKYLPNKSAKILDYGFGCGTTYLWLKINGYSNVSGVDVDNEKYKIFLQKCKEKQYPKGWEKNLTLYDGDVLPYSDNYFDYIICDNVIEHVQDVKASIKQMLRVLKSEGTIHMTLPNYAGSFEPHYYLDIQRPLKENKEYFANYVKIHNGQTDLLENLNFITPEELCSFICELEYNVKVVDNSEERYADLYIHKL